LSIFGDAFPSLPTPLFLDPMKYLAAGKRGAFEGSEKPR
jgi:hypothetical protein